MSDRDKARRAIRQGYDWRYRRTVGRSLGRTTYSSLRPKWDVHPALLFEWRFEKADRHKQAKEPFTYLNPQIRRCLTEIIEMLGLEVADSEYPYHQLLTGPAEAFEPHSGLAWYAIEIDRLYENARTHVRNGHAEWGAIKAFELGQLLTEFYLMRGAGEFFEQAARTKERQSSAGRASLKRSKEERQRVYFEHLSNGDKPIEAARNAAESLGVSLSTIRNAFPNARLPKDQPQ